MQYVAINWKFSIFVSRHCISCWLQQNRCSANEPLGRCKIGQRSSHLTTVAITYLRSSWCFSGGPLRVCCRIRRRRAGLWRRRTSERAWGDEWLHVGHLQQEQRRQSEVQLFFYFLICLFFYLSVYLFITWSIILFINLLILYLTIYWHSICPSSIYFETVSVLFKLKPIRFNIKLKKYIFKIAQKVAKYASFSFIFGLYKNQNNLRDNNLKTNPSSIQRWNFNSQSINLPHNH